MKFTKGIVAVLLLVLVLIAFAVPAFAEDAPLISAGPAADASSVEVATTAEAGTTGSKAFAAAVVVGLAAAAGAVSMGLVICKSMEGVARQPEAAGSIRTNMMLGLVFIETVVIYALIVAILIVFVL